MLKRSVIRDAKMAFRLRHILRQSVQDCPKVLVECISTIWPSIQDDPTAIQRPPNFLAGSDNCWVKVRVDFPANFSFQLAHVHLLEGHFLVMGQPIERVLLSLRRFSLSIHARALVKHRGVLIANSLRRADCRLYIENPSLFRHCSKTKAC
jgi:hypothetical protein